MVLRPGKENVKSIIVTLAVASMCICFGHHGIRFEILFVTRSEALQSRRW